MNTSPLTGQITMNFESKTGYSYATSKPAYESNKEGKAKCKEIVLNAIRSGCDCLKKIEEHTGMAQSSVSGRVGELIKDGVIRYAEGNDGFVMYQDRLRKKILINN